MKQNLTACFILVAIFSNAQTGINKIFVNQHSTEFKGYDSLIFAGKSDSAAGQILFAGHKNNADEDSVLSTDIAGKLKLKRFAAAYKYVTQTLPPEDTSKLWVDNTKGQNGAWPVKAYYNQKWSIEKYYDPVSNYTSILPPLYILATGQSNMTTKSNWGSGLGTGDIAPDNRVLYWNGNSWVVWNLGGIEYNHLAFQIAKNIAKYQNRVVRVIVSSVSGVYIADWMAPSGPRYLDIKSQIAAAGVDSINVVFWRQGEHNSSNSQTAYKVSFDTVINRMRNESWFHKIRPVVACGLCDGPSFINSGPQKYFESIPTLDDPTLLFASNNGIYSSDQIHFIGTSIDSSGLRAAAVYLFGKTKVPQTGQANNNWQLNGNTGIGTTDYFGTNDTRDIHFQTNGNIAFAVLGTNQSTIFYKDALISDVSVGRGSGAIVSNTMVGNSVGPVNTSGISNSFYGWTAGLKNTTGSNNTFIGSQAGVSQTTGAGNTYIGSVAGGSATAGNNNTAIGYLALNGNISGVDNTAIGRRAGPEITIGTANTIIGRSTGLGLTTGSYNTIIGANVSGLPSYMSNRVIISDGLGNRRINIDSIGAVGIGINDATASAILDLTSTTKGFLPPRLTSAQKTAITNPTIGLEVYDSTLKQKTIFNGTGWRSEQSGGYTQLSDATNIIWDVLKGMRSMVQIGGNRNLAINNAVDGDFGELIVVQDTNGSRVLTFDGQKPGNGSGIFLSTDPNKSDLLAWRKINGMIYWTITAKDFAN